MMRTKTISSGLAAALLAAAAFTTLSPTHVLACGASKETLSVGEQAKQEERFEAHRKAVQARNIRDIEKVLAKSKISASDRSNVKDLRDEAARLRDAGKLADADRALREAWRMLGHPELFVFTARVKC